MVRTLNSPEQKGKIVGILQSPPDIIFAVLAFALTCIGSVMLFSAGSGLEDPFASASSHLMHLAIAAIPLFFLLFVATPRSVRIIAPILYVISVGLLILVLTSGAVRNDAKRWLNLGVMMFQPSELAKTATILLLAVYFSEYRERFVIRWGFKEPGEKHRHPPKNKAEWKTFGKTFLIAFLFGILFPGLIVALPAALILAEPHFSGCIILCGIGLLMMLLGGTNLLQALLFGSPVAVGLLLLLKGTSYANARLEGLFNRGANGAADEQTTHGLWALGSGGWFGSGLGSSTMKYGYVPEPQNDFIFSIIGEELGFCGSVVIILLFLALFSRGIRLAQKCEDRMTSLVIVGISFKIILHAFLNMGVAMAVLPNTGISLPFFSSGGSSAVVLGIDLGLLLGLSRFCKYD